LRYSHNTVTVNRFEARAVAGVSVDLNVCSVLRAYCVGVVTSITCSGDVLSVLTPNDLIKQLSFIELSKFSSVKIGFSASPKLVEVISKYVSGYGGVIVVDPGIVQGIKLSHSELSSYVDSLRRNLIHRATAVVLNTTEVGLLTTDVNLLDVSSIKNSIEALVNELGIQAVAVVDIPLRGHYLSALYHGGGYAEFKTPAYLNAKDLLTAYLAVELGRGRDFLEAFKYAAEYASEVVSYGLRLDDNVLYNAYSLVELNAEKFRVIEELKKAVEVIEGNSALIEDLIPEVQMNIAYALPKPYLRGLSDVAAIPGRIVKLDGRGVKAVSTPEFGASKHLAKALIKVMEFNPEVRAVINVRYGEDILNTARGLGLTISYYDRSEEPPEVKAVEGATIPWGVEQAVRRVGYVPDIIYHKGDYGKEAMITIFGRNPMDVVTKLINIARNLPRT